MANISAEKQAAAVKAVKEWASKDITRVANDPEKTVKVQAMLSNSEAEFDTRINSIISPSYSNVRHNDTIKVDNTGSGTATGSTTKIVPVKDTTNASGERISVVTPDPNPESIKGQPDPSSVQPTSSAPTPGDIATGKVLGPEYATPISNEILKPTVSGYSQVKEYEKYNGPIDSSNVSIPPKTTDIIEKPVKNFNPFDTEKNRIDDNGVLAEQIIGSADMSVFYITEVPSPADMLDKSLCPDMWRKELIVIELDSVMSLSYSTLRERYPIRTIGHANARAYTRGPRTIAGHIAFAIFVDDVLGRIRNQMKERFDRYAQSLNNVVQQQVQSGPQTPIARPSRSFIKFTDDQFPISMDQMVNQNNTTSGGILSHQRSGKLVSLYPGTPEWNQFVDFRVNVVKDPRGQAFYDKMAKEALDEDSKQQKAYDEATANQRKQAEINKAREDYYINQKVNDFNNMRSAYESALGSVQLLDSLPPFHLLVMGTNEQGYFSKFMLKNVNITDENQVQGTQQPNIINKVNFLAQDIVPMSRFTYSTRESYDSMGSIQENYASGSFRVTQQVNELPASNLMDEINKDLAKGNERPMPRTIDYGNTDQPWRNV